MQGGGGYSRAAGEVVVRLGGLRVYPHPTSSSDAPTLVWEQRRQSTATNASSAEPLAASSVAGSGKGASGVLRVAAALLGAVRAAGGRWVSWAIAGLVAAFALLLLLLLALLVLRVRLELGCAR